MQWSTGYWGMKQLAYTFRVSQDENIRGVPLKQHKICLNLQVTEIQRDHGFRLELVYIPAAPMSVSSEAKKAQQISPPWGIMSILPRGWLLKQALERSSSARHHTPQRT